MAFIARIKGDKLRRAIVLTWLSIRFNDPIPRAQLRRMCGYESSGIYTAITNGWFAEEKGDLVLTEKSNEVIDDFKIDHASNKMILCMLIVLFFVFLVQNIMWYEYEIPLILGRRTILLTMGMLTMVNWFWYRIIWIAEKRLSPQ